MPRFVLVGLVLALAGCAAPARTATSGDLPDLNHRFAGRLTTVVLTDGSAYPADALRLDADSTSWVNPNTGEMLIVSTAAVAEVQHRSRSRTVGRSARLGATAGAVTGALLFGAVGYDTGGCIIWCSGTPTSGDRSEAALVFGLVGATLGGAEGGIVGALMGLVSDPTDRYVLDVPEARSGETPR